MSGKAPTIPDDQFVRGESPMTKQEIRLFVMAQAAVAATDVVWDVGAGTGSLSVEAALRASRGQVHAIDCDREACALIQRNAEKFGTDNIRISCGRAPAALTELPDPDIVFVGGSGGELAEILGLCANRLRPGGRLLVTAVLVETLQEALRFLSRREDFSSESCGLQVTRIRPIGNRHMFQSLNLVYVVTGRKGESV